MQRILLQNATTINYITKCDRNLLQNLSRFLLENATFITIGTVQLTVINKYLSIHYSKHCPHLEVNGCCHTTSITEIKFW